MTIRHALSVSVVALTLLPFALLGALLLVPVALLGLAALPVVGIATLVTLAWRARITEPGAVPPHAGIPHRPVFSS
jgi:hypothetical protein